MERRYKNQLFTKAGIDNVEEEVDQGCHPVVEPVAVDQETELGECKVLCPDSRPAPLSMMPSPIDHGHIVAAVPFTCRHGLQGEVLRHLSQTRRHYKF